MTKLNNKAIPTIPPALDPKAEEFRQKLIKENNNPLTEEDTEHELNMSLLRETTDKLFSDMLSDFPLPEDVTIEEKSLAIDSYTVKFRIYRQTQNKNTKSPAIIFHPGGGLAIDMQKLHDLPCALMCRTSNAVVISIQPPLTPENKYHLILEAAYNATKYCYDYPEKFGINHKQFVVCGYSMGGNLAAQIVCEAKDSPGFNISGCILISAQLDMSLSVRHNPCYNSGAEVDFMAPVSMQKLFINLCLPEGTNEIDLKNSEYSPLYGDLSDFPPTLLIGGGCDALMPDIRAAEKRLAESSVIVKTIIIPGQIHNTLLLYPLVASGDSPAKITGTQAKKIFNF